MLLRVTLARLHCAPLLLAILMALVYFRLAEASEQQEEDSYGFFRSSSSEKSLNGHTFDAPLPSLSVEGQVVGKILIQADRDQGSHGKSSCDDDGAFNAGCVKSSISGQDSPKSPLGEVNSLTSFVTIGSDGIQSPQRKGSGSSSENTNSREEPCCCSCLGEQVIAWCIRICSSRERQDSRTGESSLLAKLLHCNDRSSYSSDSSEWDEVIFFHDEKESKESKE